MRRKDSEDGYMLLAVICMLALLTIAMSVAIPEITKSLQRDKEVETMHRGKQYIRAIQLYYRKFGSYPPSIDALVNTNNIRFLRKRYLDPLTGKDDWKPIYFGQNKAPLAMGFFGQPLGGVGGSMPVAGIGPSGSGGMGSAGIGGQNGSGFGSTGSSFGSSFGGSSFGGSSGGSSFGGSSFGGSSFGGSSQGGSSVFGSSDTGNNSNTGTNASSDGTDNSGSANGGTNGGANGANGTGSSGTGFMSGQNGQTFGGGGIIGVEPVSPKPSILIYKKKDHYNQWEFTYSPLQDMMQQAGASGMGGTPNTGLNGSQGMPGSGTNGFGGGSFGGSGGTFGGGGGSFGGGGSGFGSNPQQPTQPQQQ